MANEEQLDILKQGVDVWNKWRLKNRYTHIDLSGITLKGAKLSKVNLSDSILSGANFNGADLSYAFFTRSDLREIDLRKAYLRGAYLDPVYLRGASLIEADLEGAHLNLADLSLTDFSKADLTGAELNGANLREASFENAILRIADLRHADLNEVILRGANLSVTDFSEAILRGSDFSNAIVERTIFATLDLSESIGLDDVNHIGPSKISTDTIALSKGMIPENFLRGCGLSDWAIESSKLYNPGLSSAEINLILNRMYEFRASQALQITPLFISYSHADSKFVDRLEGQLNAKGIRFWRDIHDMKAGRVERQIDRAIRQNPTVLLILSKHSLSSDWVEHEVRTARQLEKDIDVDVLCPVALDDSWKSSRWPKRVMEQVMEYNILDFSEWEDDSKFEDMFHRLIDGLELFYKR